MPLVFVHGVSVRTGRDYDEFEAARSALFKSTTLTDLVPQPGPDTVLNPYWGGHGADFAFGLASIPKKSTEFLGAGDELPATMLGQSSLAEADDPDRVLIDIAQSSLEEAVDVLWASTSELMRGSDLDDLADFGRQASVYARAVGNPQWLSEVRNNEEFVDRLQREIEGWQPATAQLEAAEAPTWESLGFGNNILNGLLDGAARVRDAAARFASRKLLDAVRGSLHLTAGIFIGDVLVYLKGRGDRNAPGPIVDIVLEDLRRAAAARSPTDPLIAVGHSFGGIILYDILSHLAPDIEVDALVTVGSQVGLFEELKVLSASSADHGAETTKVPSPPGVKAWINIFDRTDVLAYAASGVFEGVSDYEYVTGKGLLSSHTAYFVRPGFHQRLRARLGEAIS